MWLETENLAKRFGGVQALTDVSLEFLPQSITAIIGPNGAGKSTLFNVIAGYVSPDSGDVFVSYSDESRAATREGITRMSPHLRVTKGIGVLFQDVRVFQRLTALENVATGFTGQKDEQPLYGLFRPRIAARLERDVRERALKHLEFVGLAEKAQLWAGQLSYGQQKLVALARLLATDARVLLLDEPTSGVHPDMIDSLLDLIRRLAAEGRTVVMIEHNLGVVRKVGDWVYLMAAGQVEVFGKPAEVLRDSTVQEVFPTL